VTPEREKYVYEWLCMAARIVNAVMLAACITGELYYCALQADREMRDRITQQEQTQ
jgi:hypothetical protein